MITTNQTTGTSLAFDVVDRLIQLDALLELAATSEDDTAELSDRLNSLDASELRHIFNLLLERGIALASTPAVPVAVTEEASQSNV